MPNASGNINFPRQRVEGEAGFPSVQIQDVWVRVAFNRGEISCVEGWVRVVDHVGVVIGFDEGHETFYPWGSIFFLAPIDKNFRPNATE